MAEFATHPETSARAETAASRLVRSFRHVSWQRIEVDAGGRWQRATVVGVRHRLPTWVEIPLDVAAALQGRGVRTVVRGKDG